MALDGESFQIDGILFEDGHKFTRNGLEFEVFQQESDYSWGFKWTDGKQWFYSLVLRGTPSARDIDNELAWVVAAHLVDMECDVRQYLAMAA